MRTEKENSQYLAEPRGIITFLSQQPGRITWKISSSDLEVKDVLCKTQRDLWLFWVFWTEPWRFKWGLQVSLYFLVYLLLVYLFFIVSLWFKAVCITFYHMYTTLNVARNNISSITLNKWPRDIRLKSDWQGSSFFKPRPLAAAMTALHIINTVMQWKSRNQHIWISVNAHAMH